MDQSTPQRPSEENLHCIWMDAGIVSYKLCDLDFDCDNCPFDAAMKERTRPSGDRTQPATKSPSADEDKRRAPREPRQMVQDLLEPFLNSGAPEDRQYSRQHTWVKKDPDEKVSVGINHLAAALVCPLSAIVLPQASSKVLKDDALAWVSVSEGSLALRSPISGTVTEVNNFLVNQPELLRAHPYDEGWLVRIIPSPQCTLPDDLLEASEFRPILKTSVMRLREALLEQLPSTPSLRGTLFDGGSLVESLPDLIGVKAYLRILARVFSGH